MPAIEFRRTLLIGPIDLEPVGGVGAERRQTDILRAVGEDRILRRQPRLDAGIVGAVRGDPVAEGLCRRRERIGETIRDAEEIADIALGLERKPLQRRRPGTSRRASLHAFCASSEAAVRAPSQHGSSSATPASAPTGR